MSTKTTIEWTEQTWNPTTGCTEVSSGCKHCYAEDMAVRLQAMGVKGYENGFDVTLHRNRLHEPLSSKKPTIYFVNSMSDLFHEETPDSYIQEVLDVITNSHRHIFQILTKRAERMVEFFRANETPSNAWLGVTVEDRAYGLPRMDQLRQVKASIRFLSMEPLLENLGELDFSGIDWVIVGGESGPMARPMKPEWAINIKRNCEEQDVDFFFKQWGGWGADGKKRAKKKNGRLLLGRTWDDVPVALQAYFSL